MQIFTSFITLNHSHFQLCWVTQWTFPILCFCWSFPVCSRSANIVGILAFIKLIGGRYFHYLYNFKYYFRLRFWNIRLLMQIACFIPVCHERNATNNFKYAENLVGIFICLYNNTYIDDNNTFFTWDNYSKIYVSLLADFLASIIEGKIAFKDHAF